MWRINSLENTLLLENIESRRRREQQRMRWLDDITNSMNMGMSKLLEIVKDRETGVLQPSSVQSLSRVRLFVTPWTTACQALLSFTISGSLLKLMPLSQWCLSSISSSAAPFSSCPRPFPSSGSLPMSQLFTSGGQSIRASASTSVLLINIQSWFLLGLTGLISFQSKGLSRMFTSTTIWKHQFFTTAV